MATAVKKKPREQSRLSQKNLRLKVTIKKKKKALPEKTQLHALFASLIFIWSQ